ncbi:unnamed protein product [Ambrosiozyma monospora]|uniref:Unnamed protein product n=1 Tax=Ambrosiozyma monospora TaxID=43982 RepID=A0ACB5T9B1_AMBMO|nr:unnamed protein product [Ambrosiozyma monospora]
MKDERLRHLFLRLTPISGLLHAQLSPSETQQGLKRLKEYYSSYHNASTTEQTQQISKFFLYNDVLTALFPFSVKQKVQVLNQLQYESRLAQIAKCIEFANFLFEQSLNVDYILDCWKNLDTKPVSGDLLRSHFISDHLKSLRSLVEHVGSAPPRRVGGPGSMKPISGSAGSGPGNSSEDEEEDELKDIAKFIAGLDDLVMSEDGKKLVNKDFRRLKQMQNSSSSDYQVLRTYLEVIMDLPWVNKKDYTNLNSINVDCKEAKRLLDHDHYGMESVKERILEYLAVLKLHERINKLNEAKSLKNTSEKKSHVQEFTFGQGDQKSNASIEEKKQSKAKKLEQDAVVSKAPILLLTGPPGVGKTSLAKSIASTLGRKFQRISVGGLNDFADLKGHRRTYVGAIPDWL